MAARSTKELLEKPVASATWAEMLEVFAKMGLAAPVVYEYGSNVACAFPGAHPLKPVLQEQHKAFESHVPRCAAAAQGIYVWAVDFPALRMPSPLALPQWRRHTFYIEGQPDLNKSYEARLDIAQSLGAMLLGQALCEAQLSTLLMAGRLQDTGEGEVFACETQEKEKMVESGK